jgi:hypothetical protein
LLAAALIFTGGLSLHFAAGFLSQGLEDAFFVFDDDEEVLFLINYPFYFDSSCVGVVACFLFRLGCHFFFGAVGNKKLFICRLPVNGKSYSLSHFLSPACTDH